MTTPNKKIEKKCIICEEVFYSGRSREICCKSAECKKRRLLFTGNRHRIAKRGYDGHGMSKCLICDEEFDKTCCNKKICSTECKKIYMRHMDKLSRPKYRERYMTDSEFKIRHKIGGYLQRMIYTRVLSAKTQQHRYHPFVINEFKEKFESLFEMKMSWENYGEWHIDHIKPLTKFKLVNDDGTENLEMIRLANDLNNLQPLWALDNIKKRDKWEE